MGCAPCHVKRFGFGWKGSCHVRRIVLRHDRRDLHRDGGASLYGIIERRAKALNPASIAGGVVFILTRPQLNIFYSRIFTRNSWDLFRDSIDRIHFEV